jgi:signal transduction histidine kinase
MSKSGALAAQYRAALGLYLAKRSGASVQPALRLGRAAVARGLETLDLALIHEQALLAHVLKVDTATARGRMVRRANLFFAEAIVPMEKGHHVAREANVRLSRMNADLSRRTRDLAASNRHLKSEIARRQVVEETLRQSERQSVALLAQSRRLQEELRLLSRRILSVQEEERKRISRELHDVIAQVLTGINVRLAVLKAGAAADAKGLGRKIASTQRLVERSVDIVHRFAHDLRPAALDHLGLIPAMQTFLKTFSKDTGIQVHLTAYAGVQKMNSAGRTVLYRVAQEALTNVARHARATRVEIGIHRSARNVSMEIRDDGRAFDAERTLRSGKSKRMGLLGMRERVEMVGGGFAIESARGTGTVVKVWIPFRTAREPSNA